MVKCPRKVWNDTICFKDKESLKHNHEYTIQCLFEEHLIGKNCYGPKYWIKYYEVLMCTHCHSFIFVSKPGNFSGYITSSINGDKHSLTKEQEKLPRIIAKRSGKVSGLENVDEYLFPDGKKYTNG